MINATGDFLPFPFFFLFFFSEPPGPRASFWQRWSFYFQLVPHLGLLSLKSTPRFSLLFLPFFLSSFFFFGKGKRINGLIAWHCRRIRSRAPFYLVDCRGPCRPIISSRDPNRVVYLAGPPARQAFYRFLIAMPRALCASFERRQMLETCSRVSFVAIESFPSRSFPSSPPFENPLDLPSKRIQTPRLFDCREIQTRRPPQASCFQPVAFEK